MHAMHAWTLMDLIFSWPRCFDVSMRPRQCVGLSLEWCQSWIILDPQITYQYISHIFTSFHAFLCISCLLFLILQLVSIPVAQSGLLSSDPASQKFNFFPSLVLIDMLCENTVLYLILIPRYQILQTILNQKDDPKWWWVACRQTIVLALRSVPIEQAGNCAAEMLWSCTFSAFWNTRSTRSAPFLSCSGSTKRSFEYVTKSNSHLSKKDFSSTFGSKKLRKNSGVSFDFPSFWG